MFFILSKVLSFLLNLLLWVFAFLLIAIFAKNTKRKRKFLIIGVVLLYIFSCPLLLNFFACKWDVQQSGAEKGKVYSCAIVLGGFTSEDANGQGYFNGSADRFIQGVLLQKTGRVKRILISSGNGDLNPDGFEEADWVKIKLKQMQVPDSVVLIENRSRNTIENASLSKILLQKQKISGPYLLVTSAFHMRRSMMIFKKEGIDVVPYPCNFLGNTNKISFEDILPSAGIMAGWGVYIKEVIGYMVTYFK